VKCAQTQLEDLAELLNESDKVVLRYMAEKYQVSHDVFDKHGSHGRFKPSKNKLVAHGILVNIGEKVRLTETGEKLAMALYPDLFPSNEASLHPCEMHAQKTRRVKAK